jgi:hypothetical protein
LAVAYIKQNNIKDNTRLGVLLLKTSYNLNIKTKVIVVANAKIYAVNDNNLTACL